MLLPFLKAIQNYELPAKVIQVTEPTTYFHGFPEVIGEILFLSDSVARNVSYHRIAYLLEIRHMHRNEELNFILSRLLQLGFGDVLRLHLLTSSFLF